MLLHTEPVRSQRAHSANATNQIKQPFALLAQEKVVVMPGCAFVMGRHPGNFHRADLTVGDKLFNRPVYRRNPKGRNLATRFPAYFRGRERLLGALKHFAQNKLLLRQISHRCTLQN